MNKKYWMCVLAAVAVGGTTVQAQQYNSEPVMNEIAAIRQELEILQRQVYREQNDGISNPRSAADIAVKIGEFDEKLRRLSGVQTVLCGHGHGGIVRLPFVGAVFGTHLDLFPDYTAGLYRKGQTSMIVSRGLGGSRKLPLRIGNRPEIVTVILKAESGKV